MPEITGFKLAELTKLDRATVRKRLNGAKFRRDGDNEKCPKYYLSEEVLILRDFSRPDNEEHLSPQDALAVARRKQIDLEMEVTRKERPRLEDVLESAGAVFDDIAGIIKSSELSEELKGDIFARLKAGMEELKSE